MPIIPIIAAKGSPGATSVALITASLLRDYYNESVFLEADPAGGDLALRYQRSLRPGLITLAAERKLITSQLLNDHCQIIQSLKVIFGTQGYEQFALVESTVTEAANCYATKDKLMVIDLGRWVRGFELSKNIIANAKFTILVIDNSPNGIVSARSILSSLDSFGSKILICMTGMQLFEVLEVESFLKHKVIATFEDIYKASSMVLDLNGNVTKIKSDLGKTVISFQENLVNNIGETFDKKSEINQDCIESHFDNIIENAKESTTRRRIFRRSVTETEIPETTIPNKSSLRAFEGDRYQFDENEYMELVEE